MSEILRRTAPLSQRAEPSPLWFRTFRERRIGRGTTRISRVPCEKAKRGCASRVPLPPGLAACRARGVLVERATPPFSPLVRHRRGKRCRQRCRPFASPFGEVALSTVIPGGKAIGPARRPALGTAEPRQRTGRPQLAHWLPRVLEDRGLYPRCPTRGTSRLPAG